jgi:hypothetical protein
MINQVYSLALAWFFYRPEIVDKNGLVQQNRRFFSIHASYLIAERPSSATAGSCASRNHDGRFARHEGCWM